MAHSGTTFCVAFALAFAIGCGSSHLPGDSDDYREENAPPPPDAGSGEAQAPNVPQEPTIIADSQQAPAAIAVDGHSVYWMNLGVNGTTDSKTPLPWIEGTVYKCNLSGCPDGPVQLASGLKTNPGRPTPMPLDVNRQHLYWADAAGLSSCDPENCEATAETVPSVFVERLLVTESQVYWSGGQQLASCVITDCNGPAKAWSDAGLSRAIALDDQSIYWATSRNLLKCPREGCDRSTNILPAGMSFEDKDFVNLRSLTVDAEFIFFTSGSGGTVVKCAKSDCQSGWTLLADALDQPTVIKSDGINVYWIERTAVRKCSVNGCNNTPTTIASGLDYPVALALDKTSVYWAELGSPNLAASWRWTTGRIWRAPK